MLFCAVLLLRMSEEGGYLFINFAATSYTPSTAGLSSLPSHTVR
jgi:hypothetical protein